LNKRLNDLMNKKKPKDYRNAYIRKVVNFQDGDYLLKNRNFFLTSKKIIAGKEINTIKFNLNVILLMIILTNIITLVKLRYFYK
jgi:hypothetical protein